MGELVTRIWKLYTSLQDYMDGDTLLDNILTGCNYSIVSGVPKCAQLALLSRHRLSRV